MNSHPCVKTGGGVSPASEPISQSAISESLTCQPVTCEPATTSAPVSPELLTSDRCRYENRRRQQCRLSTSSPDSELCPHHTRQLRARNQRLNDKDANELLGDLTDFSTPEAVNALLGNLVRQLARKRISRLDAVAIAYVSQLLLGSISSMDRHDAALRAADAGSDADDFPRRIVFDRPDPLPSDYDPTTNPIWDSLRVAASFATSRISEPRNTEGRA